MIIIQRLSETESQEKRKDLLGKTIRATVVFPINVEIEILNEDFYKLQMNLLSQQAVEDIKAALKDKAQKILETSTIKPIITSADCLSLED